LDDFEIRKTLKDLSLYGRGKVFGEDEVEDFLTYYGLYRDGNLTNATVVLFAKEPTRYLPQCRVRLTVFRGSKSSDTFVNDRFFEGNLFQNVDAIIQFCDINIAISSKFSEKKWHREDAAFPKLALREGLMNAFIHRDFSSVSSTVAIAFYPDRLEITNSGELYGGYTPLALTKNHLSVPRNPDIAHICFLRQLIEKIGRGTIKMIEDCESKGYPEPVWQSNSGFTTLTFKGITITSKADDAVNDAVNNKIIGAVNDGVKGGLTDVVNIVLPKENGISINEIINSIGKSHRTVQRYLQILKAIGFIEFRGVPKSGKYFTTQKAMDRISGKKN
jgi:ATP-dependent DNA helicase RecG